MKISHLSIKSFLALSHLELDLQAPITILCGPNEAGKSSIRDAIQWGLTGCARGLKTHEQQALLINEGGKAAEVSLTFEGGRKISRRKTLKSPPTVAGTLPDDLALTTALCDSHHFLALPDDQRRAELFRLIPGLNPTAEDIAKRLREFIPDPNISLSGLQTIASTKGFKAAETEAVTRRRMAKRVRDDLQVKEPETEWIHGEGEAAIRYILPDINTQQVDEGLGKLTAQRDKLLKKQGKVEGELDKLPDLEAELAALVIPEPPGENEIKEWEKPLEVNRSNLEQLRVEYDALEQGAPAKLFPDVCPAYNLPCPSKGKVAVAAVAPAGPAKAKKIKADFLQRVGEVGLLEVGLKAAQDKVAAYTQALNVKVDLETKIAALKDQQTRATETASLQEQIDVLSARITLGEELKDQVREFWRSKKAAEEAAVKIEEADKDITLYDTLAKALAPDGIQSQLIAEALGPVNDLLSLASSHLFPGRTLELTQDLEVMLSGAPFTTLSKSARFRVGVAFQFCLAKLAGARLLLIDEADLLDTPNRSQLISFLMETLPDFSNIMIFSTAAECPAPSPIPEIQIWWMEKGKALPVMAEKAA